MIFKLYLLLLLDVFFLVVMLTLDVKAIFVQQ